MRNELKFASVLLAATMFVGCEKKEETVTAPAPAPATPSNTVSDTVKDVTAGVKGAAGDAQTQVNTAATDATAMAQTKLKEVGEYIAQKKFDLADTALKQVEEKKSSLPESLQTQVTALRTQLDAAKAAGGITLPSMPK